MWYTAPGNFFLVNVQFGMVFPMNSRSIDSATDPAETIFWIFNELVSFFFME